MRRQRALALFIALALSSVAAAGPKEIPYEWKGVSRIVALGDIHGAYDQLVAVLRNAGLVDDHLQWIGGSAHLVQNGDVVDRGPDSRKCMDLLMKLERQARHAGGEVHVLIGNHEAMDVMGLLDYVSEQEFASYADRDSGRRRERAFQHLYRKQKQDAKKAGEKVPGEDEARKEFESKYPLGYVEHRRAFSPKGEYGRWILTHNVAILIDGIVFSHGDWSEEFAALGIAEVNRRVREELAGGVPGEPGIAFDARSPLQYRGLAEVELTRVAQQANLQEVDRILALLKAERMVVGHTVTAGVIEPRFGGKHISIDAGMLELYQGGHRVALEIEGDSLRAIHPDGKVPLPDHLDETNVFDYLREVAVVDPENVTVYSRLADEYLRRKDWIAARAVLEQLFRIPKPVPFTYRKELAETYTQLGEAEKAEAQNLAYLEGLRQVAESRPDNVHIINLLARFSLEKHLAMESAEKLLSKAIEKQPQNPSLLVTLGRIQLDGARFQQAVETLEKAVAVSPPGYETLYYLGLAYLGIGERQRARDAFEKAIEREPSRSEAREELRKLGISGSDSRPDPQAGIPLPAALR